MAAKTSLSIAYGNMHPWQERFYRILVCYNSLMALYMFL
jgi:hypothetical protein